MKQQYSVNDYIKEFLIERQTWQRTISAIAAEKKIAVVGNSM